MESAFVRLGLHPWECRVILCEPLFVSRSQRERNCQLLFESLNVSAVAFIPCPLAIAWGAGRSSAWIVDAGRSHTTVVPILRGSLYRAAAASTPAAGRLVESVAAACRVPLDCVHCVGPECGAGVSVECPEVATHTLPCGRSVELQRLALHMPTFNLFPADAACDSQTVTYDGIPSVASVAAEALSRVPVSELRHLTSVVCAGGLSALKRFPQRVATALTLTGLRPMGMPAAPFVVPMADPGNAACIGAQLMSDLPLKHVFVDRSEYDEYGPRLAHRRAL